MNKWETAASMPDLNLLLELSHLYKVTINEILEPNQDFLITEMEEIISIDQKILAKVLKKFTDIEIIKASMAVSPLINDYLKEIYKGLDFDGERIKIKSIKVEEVEGIHKRIVEAVNAYRNQKLI